jgi:hypothetical protein
VAVVRDRWARVGRSWVAGAGSKDRAWNTFTEPVSFTSAGGTLVGHLVRPAGRPGDRFPAVVESSAGRDLRARRQKGETVRPAPSPSAVNSAAWLRLLGVGWERRPPAGLRVTCPHRPRTSEQRLGLPRPTTLGRWNGGRAGPGGSATAWAPGYVRWDGKAVPARRARQPRWPWSAPVPPGRAPDVEGALRAARRDSPSCGPGAKRRGASTRRREGRLRAGRAAPNDRGRGRQLPSTPDRARRFPSGPTTLSRDLS